MKIELSAHEARVIGCLIEKQITTPDQYPLSLNALTNACNQKSNRDPVLDLDEATVQQVIDGLIRKHLVIEKAGFGGRVPKYQQLFFNSNFGSAQLSPQERGLICELLLRGPQTPGELRSRAARLCELSDVQQVEAALETLMRREDGPLVVKLAREPGRRESRYAQLFTGEIHAPAAAQATQDETEALPSLQRLERLEDLVRALREEVEQIKRKLD